MLDENISESKHLASLDFDISKIDKQMKEVERIVQETGLTLKQLVDSKFNIGEAINSQIQTAANGLKGSEVNITNSVKRVGTSVKNAVSQMVADGDPTAMLAQYLRQGSKKLAVSWTGDMESEFSKRVPELKKSLSSYISWDYLGKAPGIDAFQGELESMGLITNGMLSQADIMEDIYNRINKYRDTRNSIVSGEYYEDEINSLNRYRFALDETEEELRDLLNAQNLSRQPLKDFTGTKLGSFGSDDLDKRIAQIREAAGMEEQLKISTDEEGHIRRAIVDYTDQQGRKIRETINLSNQLNKSTGEMEVKVKDTNFDYIDQPLKRANEEMKALQANFKIYSDLKMQNETKNMLPKEEAIMQERLTKASKDYQESLVKVAQYANQGLITEQQFVDLALKDKEVQNDIVIAKEKQAQADDKKYQSIVMQFEKEQAMLQQNLASSANSVQKNGLGEQHLVDIRKIQIELEQLGKQSSVITQDELTRLNILKKQADEIFTQVNQEKENAALNKKQAQDEKTLLSIYERSSKLQSEISRGKITGNSALKQEASLIKQQAEQLFNRLSTDGKITNEMREQTAELSKQLNLLETQARVNTVSNPKVNNNSMFSEIASKAKWYVAGSAAFAGGYVAKQTLQTLTDVEYKVMEITRVMNDSTLDIQSFQTELFNLAIDYGRSFDDVSEVALRYAQAGYSVNETISMTKDSLLALNTAELDVENSTQSMIGIMQQWGYTATELSTIIDKINYTADNNAITSQDLVDGLLQAGSAAKTAKISFDDTIGTLTAMKEASGRTGREVGNAFKSIIAYTQRDKSFATFESLGIDVYTDKAKTMLRPTLDLLGDLSDKWKQNGDIVVDTLMKDEGAAELLNENMAELIGSSENYSAVKKAESDINNKSLTDTERLDAVQTAGMHRRTYFISLLENFNKIQEVSNDLQNAEGYSLKENSRHMETLQAKTIQLVESLKQLAVQAGEAGLLDLAKGAVDAATGVAGLTKDIGGVVPALTIVLGVIMALKREKIASGLLDLGSNIKGLVSNFGALKTSAISTSGAITTVGISTQALIGFIGLATVAITATIGAITYFNNKAEEARQATIEAGIAASGTIKSLSELKEKYDDLSGVSSKTTEQETEFKKIQEELITILGSKSDSLNNLTSGTEAYRLELEKLTAAEIDSQKQALVRAKHETENKVNDLFVGPFDNMTSKIDFDTTENEHKDLFEKYLGKYRSNESNNAISVFVPTKNDIDAQIEWYKNLKQLLDEITKTGDMDSFSYDEINNEVSRLAPTMKEAIKIQNNLNEISSVVSETLFVQGQKTGELSDVTANNSATMTNSNTVIDETQTKLQELADLYDLVSSGEEVSITQILDLIQKYPQYAAEISNVNTNKQAMIDITNTLAEQEKIAAIAKLEDDKKQIQSNIALISSTLQVAKAKLYVLQMNGGEIAFGDIITETQKEISAFDAEIQKSLGDIKALDGAISTLEKLDLSSYSTKKTSSSKSYAEKEKEDAIKAQTDAINEQIKSIEHLGSTGAYTLQEQIDLYKELLVTSSKTTEIRQKLETNLHNLYKKQIDENIKLAEKEKNDKIQAIKDSADREIKALQKIKDERDSQRDEEDYNGERSEILEDISYWEQRTGQEAVTSLADLKKRLAELDKNYQRKLEDEETQMQIKDLEEKRDREIRHIEDTWENVQSVFDSENLIMTDKATLYASSLFTEYDMNFLKPFIDKISLIKDNMAQLASAAERAKENTQTAKNPPVKAYAVGTTKAARGWANLDENGEEIVFRKPIQGRYSFMEKGEAVLPHRISENIMDIGQYSLNQIMDKAEFIIAPALQAQLANDMQRIQQNYTNSINNNYNNSSSDNRNSTDFNVKIENNNYIEDTADGQALANATARLILKSVKTLPYKR